LANNKWMSVCLASGWPCKSMKLQPTQSSHYQVQHSGLHNCVRIHFPRVPHN
jgi:hypothetical protein